MLVNIGMVKWKKGVVYYVGNYFKVWDSYGLENYKFCLVFFNEDVCGCWYFNVVVEYEVEVLIGISLVGIDFGCKDVVIVSDG